MAQLTTGVQPAVLKWARETHGYTVNDVAERLKRKPDEITAWESGEAAPTYAQLESLAYDVYKRPLAVFFFPEPPAEPTPQQAFRSLPNTELKNLEPNTRYQIRLAMALQTSLKELHDGENPSERPIFRHVKLSLEQPVPAQAAQVRTFLFIDMNVQIEWRDDDDALKAWRGVIENAGVFVFKNSFKQKAISGFCLLDAQFPIIYLNNSTTKTRQIFSLLHELAHVLLEISTVSRFELDAPQNADTDYAHVERFCNAFAAEMLMPSEDFKAQARSINPSEDEAVKRLAARYGVSREAVLRRLLELDRVTPEYYARKAKEWTAQMKAPSGGGDYYATQASYLGEHYLQLVLRRYSQGALTLEQAASHLGVKAKSIAGLEEILARKGVNA